MGKGCLVKGLIISTILFAGLFYVLTMKFDEWVVNPIKNTVYSANFDDVEKSVSVLKDSPYKDSLIVIIKKYTKEFKDLEKIDIQEIGEKAAKIGSFLEDSTVTKEDFRQIKELLEITKQNNEKPKEN